jgi:TolB-like protein/class 3 adenylate cyclase/Tfp pilus assembly protein PilF
MTQESFKRKLAAILSADVEGYSRLMQADEEATIQRLTTYRTAMTTLIQQYRGRLVDAPGDNLLAEFGSVVDAVNCAVEIQRELAERNAELPEERRMQFRIGVNLGDVFEEGERIYGDGVNIAARMESMAKAGGICVSGTVYDSIVNKLGLEYENLGEQTVKNILEPIRSYRVLSYPGAAAHRVVKAKRAVRRKWRKAALAIAAVLIIGVGAVGIWYFFMRPAQFSIETASEEKMAFPLPDKPSIAVLPFVNMSGDPNQEYIADGFTEQIITTLSRVSDVFVIARTSAFTYKGKPVKIKQISEELGVRYVLEGSVQRSGDKIRIPAQLIDALSGTHLWAERYDRHVEDIFAIQDEISLKVLTEIQIKLTEGEDARLFAIGSRNLTAYLTYMQALEQIYRMNKDGVILAQQLLEEAIALDPQFPAAYVFLAHTHTMAVRLGYSKSPQQSLLQASQLAEKALALDDSYSLAYALLCTVHSLMRQHEKAIELGERAITLNPNNAMSHALLGVALAFGGKPTEAIPVLEKALRLDPIPESWIFDGLGFAYHQIGQYEEAIKSYNKALRRSPNDLYAHINLTASYSETGRLEKARVQAAELLKINPKFSLSAFAKAYPFKNQDDLERFVDALRKAGLK